MNDALPARRKPIPAKVGEYVETSLTQEGMFDYDADALIEFTQGRGGGH